MAMALLCLSAPLRQPIFAAVDRRRRGIHDRLAGMRVIKVLVRRMKNLATLLTTILTVVALFALTGWQVTSETAATRLLGRLGAAIIEIDRWLPAHQEDIELVARDRERRCRPGPRPADRGDPPSSLVIDAEEARLRTLITEEMGRKLYEDGNSAFRDNDGEEPSLGVE